MTGNPTPDLVLDQMYEHPERFTHLTRDEYLRILIEDIRDARGLAHDALRLAKAYQHRLVLMHGHEDAACPAPQYRAMLGFGEALDILEKQWPEETSGAKLAVLYAMEEQLDALYRISARPGCTHCHGRGTMQDGGRCTCIP